MEVHTLNREEHISTEEVADLFGVQAASIRHALTVRGSYFGLRPVKRPNRFLAWPRSQVDAVLRGERPAGES